MSSQEPEEGDKVSWKWGGGAPGGTVAETKHEGEIAIKSKRGNIIKKNASPDNPAVRVERSGNDVVKRASELTVEVKANKAHDKKKVTYGSGKRQAESQQGSRSDKTEGDDDVDDLADPHVVNRQGKEVSKGGKDANKKQKRHQGENTKGEKNGVKPAGKHKTGTTRNTASQGGQDTVSSRTRSHEKAS